MRQEKIEQLELGRRQLEFFAAGEDAVRVTIQFKRTGTRSGFLPGRLPAPQMRFTARDELANAEGLGYIIIAAQFEPQHTIDFLRSRRKEQNGRLSQRGIFTDLAAKIESVRLR